MAEPTEPVSTTLDESEFPRIPDELPPVQPPSAGFIVQLFVVPGLIVCALIGGLFLFRHLTSGEADWQRQVEELRHPNVHRRWRGAMGLAQILQADQERGATGQRLSRQPEIANSIANALVDELKHNSAGDDDLKYQAFLARTLGLFDLTETVFPVLERAMQPERDREVRKNALGAVAAIANRQPSAAETSQGASIINSVIGVSADEDRLIRQTAAYTLGLLPTRSSLERLTAMLDDADKYTQANAAIGLARNHDVRGLKVLRSLLAEALERTDPGSPGEFERFVSVKNAIAAIQNLAADLRESDRQEFAALLRQIGAGHKEPVIATEARSAVMRLEAAAHKETK